MGRRIGDLCRQYGISDSMPRPIIPGDKRALNKRIVEALANQCYWLELDNYPSNPRGRQAGRPSHQPGNGLPDVVELAEIFRLYGPAYRARFGQRMLPRHLKAMRAIEQCRTAALGGQVYTCPHCGESRYVYHSCRDRHCPKCQNANAQEWLVAQHDLLLPTPYFMLTFTLPAALRDLARGKQRLFAALLSMPPLCRVWILLFCSRILTRLVSTKCPPLRRCAHPILPKISLPPRQTSRSIRRCTLLHPPKLLRNSTYRTLPHIPLP